MTGPIVVTMDGSAESEWVIPLAAELARRADVELQQVQVHTLTNVLKRVHAADVSLGLAARESALARLQSLARRTKSPANTRAVLLDGEVAPALQRYIEQVQPSIVLMCPGDPSELARVIAGDEPTPTAFDEQRPAPEAGESSAGAKVRT